MSRRAEQLAATLQKAIQESISRGLQDPRVRGMITVTGVRMDDDLRTAVVSVSVYPESAQNPTIHGLASAASHIRRELQETVEMRTIPELIFKLDESLKKQAAVLGAINRATTDKPGSWPASPGAAPTAEGDPA